jgi:hypothetical protein
MCRYTNTSLLSRHYIYAFLCVLLKALKVYVFLWQYLAYELECMVHIFLLLLKHLKLNIIAGIYFFGCGILWGYFMIFHMFLNNMI